MLKIEDLSLKKKNHLILNRVRFEAPRKTLTLLLGKSGCGKTSILRCLAQLEQAYEGKISIDGFAFSSVSMKNRSTLIGFVSQSYALFPHMNALDNCIHPYRTVFKNSKKEAVEKAKRLFAFLGLEKYASSFSHELSGGQQQRVAIARALMLDPIYLLLDEPTSALDPENTNKLIEILTKLKEEGRGIVIATQDMAFATKIYDKIVFLEEGVLLETAEGRVSEKLASFLNNF